MTLTAGIYDLPVEQYHLDPCAEPSLSSSGIRRLLTGSPAEFRAYHPRLTEWPDLPKKATSSMDNGTIAHALTLGDDCSFHALDPEDCPARTKKGEPYHSWAYGAADWKAEQQAAGVRIISRKDGAKIFAAVDAMKAFVHHKYKEWDSGASEVTVIWQRNTGYGPIWCRARIDRWIARELAIVELKFTDKPITKHHLRKKLASELLAIQIAWQIEGLIACHPNADLAGRIDGRIPVQELTPPYQTVRLGITETRLEIARQRIDRAVDLFAKCLYGNAWPGEEEDFSPEPETWELTEFENEEIAR